jgi:hypothetical protein
MAFRQNGEPITAAIDGSTVTFHYLGDWFRPALARYVVSGETAISSPGNPAVLTKLLPDS